MVETVAQVQKKIVKGAIILNTIVSLGAAFLMETPKPFVIGVLFGTIVGILNFRLLYLSLNKAVKMPPHRAQVHAATNYLMRYILIGVVLFVSIKRAHINVLGTIVGLIAIKLVILKYELFNDKNYFLKIFKRKEEK